MDYRYDDKRKKEEKKDRDTINKINEKHDNNIENIEDIKKLDALYIVKEEINEDNEFHFRNHNKNLICNKMDADKYENLKKNHAITELDSYYHQWNDVQENTQSNNNKKNQNN